MKKIILVPINDPKVIEYVNNMNLGNGGLKSGDHIVYVPSGGIEFKMMFFLLHLASPLNLVQFIKVQACATASELTIIAVPFDVFDFALIARQNLSSNPIPGFEICTAEFDPAQIELTTGQKDLLPYVNGIAMNAIGCLTFQSPGSRDVHHVMLRPAVRAA